jgi:hypothetical protein
MDPAIFAWAVPSAGDLFFCRDALAKCGHSGLVHGGMSYEGTICPLHGALSLRAMISCPPGDRPSRVTFAISLLDYRT